MVAIAGAGAGAGVDCGISNSNHRHTSTATASRFSHARTFVLFSAVCCHVQNNRAITNKNSAKPLFERPVSSNNTTLVCSCASPQPPLRAPLRCAASVQSVSVSSTGAPCGFFFSYINRHFIIYFLAKSDMYVSFNMTLSLSLSLRSSSCCGS